MDGTNFVTKTRKKNPVYEKDLVNVTRMKAEINKTITTSKNLTLELKHDYTQNWQHTSEEDTGQLGWV